MAADATFEEGAERPLYLAAEDAEGLSVIAALTQDAVLTATDIRWERKSRRLVLLLNRFRWEDREAAERRGRAFERVRSLLVIGDVTQVASQGIDRTDAGMVLSLIGIAFAAGADGTGVVTLTLAGDGAVRAEVECLNVTLKDVTRPYAALSGKAPGHPE
jgi:Protein of unknown function (DUF2948)